MKSLCLLDTETDIVQESLDVMKSENNEKVRAKSFTNVKAISSNRIDHQFHNEKIEKINSGDQIKQYELKKNKSTTISAKSAPQEMDKIENYTSSSLKKDTRSTKIDQPLIMRGDYLREEKDAQHMKRNQGEKIVIDVLEENKPLRVETKYKIKDADFINEKNKALVKDLYMTKADLKDKHEHKLRRPAHLERVPSHNSARFAKRKEEGKSEAYFSKTPSIGRYLTSSESFFSVRLRERFRTKPSTDATDNKFSRITRRATTDTFSKNFTSLSSPASPIVPSRMFNKFRK